MVLWGLGVNCWGNFLSVKLGFLYGQAGVTAPGSSGNQAICGRRQSCQRHESLSHCSQFSVVFALELPFSLVVCCLGERVQASQSLSASAEGPARPQFLMCKI